MFQPRIPGAWTNYFRADKVYNFNKLAWSDDVASHS